MIKKKKWQLSLILCVMILTVYNILPTVLFYSKPLNEPVSKEYAGKVVESIMARVNSLDEKSVEWIESFNGLLGIKPESVSQEEGVSQVVKVSFKSRADANLFKKFLPRAGSLVPFFPSQLSLMNGDGSLTGTVKNPDEVLDNVVYVQRKIPLKFDTNDPSKYFSYEKMFTEDGSISPGYADILSDRLFSVVMAGAGQNENAGLFSLIANNTNISESDRFVEQLANEIVLINKIFGTYPKVEKRFYSTFTQNVKNPRGAIERVISNMTSLKERIQMEKLSLKNDETTTEGEIGVYESRESRLLSAISILKKDGLSFVSSIGPMSDVEAMKLARETVFSASESAGDRFKTIQIDNRNPIIESVTFDSKDLTFSLKIRQDLLSIRDSLGDAVDQSSRLNSLNQLVFNEIAKISRESDEKFVPDGDNFVLTLRGIAKQQWFYKF